MRALVAAHPVLEPIVDETTLEDGEILAYPFFGLIAFEIVRQLRVGALDPELADVLPDLEIAFQTADARAGEYISGGFLRDLPYEGLPGGEINSMLGPSLARELASRRDWGPYVHFTGASADAIRGAWRRRRALPQPVGPADATSQLAITTEHWWRTLADWATEEVAGGCNEAEVRGLLADLEAEVARPHSRGRAFIVDWFVPQLLADGTGEGTRATIRSMLGPHLLAGR